MNLDDSARGFAPAFRTALTTRKLTVLAKEDGSLSGTLIRGLETRGFSQTCNTVVVCPLQPTTHDKVLGFLALGLSCRRPYDQGYRMFIDLLTTQLRSSLASVVLFEDEKKKGRSAAEEAVYKQTQLLMNLQERAREAELLDLKFKLLAERAPVGIFEYTPDGQIKFANTAYYELTGQDPEDSSAMTWLVKVHDDDLAMVLSKWAKILVDLQPVTEELRLKRPWQAAHNGDEIAKMEYTWVLAAAYPVLADDGSVAGITGTVTDISSQKWSVEIQTQRITDMLESKRQQENFVDMTSHEMRNPLNAMLLCAEDLYGTLDRIQALGTAVDLSDKSIVGHCIDSAETILYCGRHQKRIIDDILTLSKLDAKLLNITPIEVQPVAVVQDALRLFESELRAQDIELKLSIDSSYKDLDVETVLMDPSRVVQILVNFIANAIKFTKGEDLRRMTVTIGASRQKPTDKARLAGTPIRLVPSGRMYQDLTTRPEWGTGEHVYLHFGVHDTGPGLSEEEMVTLFSRFSQTLPRTHAHCGGSGLGLFISQQLAELQAGEVGVASEMGVGSSFFFYVKARQKIKNASPGLNTIEEAHARKRHSASIRPSTSIPPPGDGGGALSKGNILVVEDNLVNQKVLCKQLQKLGYKLSIANNGEEALAVIRKSKYWRNNTETGTELDVILMDIEMPVMDGRICVKRIRDMEQEGAITVHLPVVAVTANARQEQIVGAKELGFVSCKGIAYESVLLTFFEGRSRIKTLPYA